MDLRDEDLAQWIRLLDVFGIGPLMIYAGVKSEEELPRWVRGALVLFGITTIGYNGMNYLSVREERDAAMAQAYAKMKARELQGEGE